MRLGILMVLAAAVSWGTWSLFLTPSGLPPTVTAPIVFAVMFVVGLPMALREPPATWDRTSYRLFFAYVVFDALNLTCFFSALATTTVQIAVLSHYATPILIALAAPRIDGVSTPGARPAAVVALAGLVIVLEPWNPPPEGTGNPVLGVAFGLASAVCYSGNVFVLRRLVGRIGAGRTMSYHSLFSGLLVLPLGFAHLSGVTFASALPVILGAIGPGTVAGIVFSLGLARIGSARTAILTFAEPVVAVSIGALVWGEALHPLASVGGAMILGAGIYVARKSG